ncbi:MAG: hypothetical protein HDQ88_07350 [Clostridia bacterium]|nr:hypothetical protein [Clostridia bacterium]
MNSDNEKQVGPLQNLFNDIKKIFDFIEFKDMREAEKYETEDVKIASNMWMDARTENDTYLSYLPFWRYWMFQEVQTNIGYRTMDSYFERPSSVPAIFHENLRKRGREAFLECYEEQNEYYRTLSGLPPLNTPKHEYIHLSPAVRAKLHVEDKPVHEYSEMIQTLWMNMDDYEKVLNDNPDKEYLRYLGYFKIDPFIARNAKDFEIIRYALTRSDVNPTLIKEFASVYADYREYVMVGMYNTNLEGVYPTYRLFMRLIIQAMALMHICNRGIKSITTRQYIDDSIIHIILSMYDLDEKTLLSNDIRRLLTQELPKLVQMKGTDEIYEKLIQILGYSGLSVKKYMLMKGQQFDPDDNYKALDEFDPYFIPISIDRDNEYISVKNGKNVSESYPDTIKDDQTWWDLPDTRNILQDRDYSIANSKYVSIEATIHQMKYIFESQYFAKMILDNKETSKDMMLDIPAIFGTSPQPLYDVIVFIIAASCMNIGAKDTLSYKNDELYATPGFNFNLDYDGFIKYLDSCKHIDTERIRSFMSNFAIQVPEDFYRIYHDVIYPMRDYLERMIVESDTREEFIEYENIYKALYTYDLANNPFDEDFKSPMKVIQEKYGISDEDLLAYRYFYPRTGQGYAVHVDNMNTFRYEKPFPTRQYPVDWYVHLVLDTDYGEDDRGYVYFHDILNSKDMRYLEDIDGNRIFMDYEDETGWKMNTKAVNKFLSILMDLPDDMMYHAVFQKDIYIRDEDKIPSDDKEYFHEREPLPKIIRSELYKDILYDKANMDLHGLADPPTTYTEYLYRRNEFLYDILIGNGKFKTDRVGWLDDIMTVIQSVEQYIGLYLKYFEQSVVGDEHFFKPLITLINYFKSTFVFLKGESTKLYFDDKMDVGGNSNMLKFFDDMEVMVRFIILAETGYNMYFGLYDTIHSLLRHFHIDEGIGFYDVMKFSKNGDPEDPDGGPSWWMRGEDSTLLYPDKEKNPVRTYNKTVERDNYEME